jgi:hypothetical protein
MRADTRAAHLETTTTETTMKTIILPYGELETFRAVHNDGNVRKLARSPFFRLLARSAMLEYLQFASETLAETGAAPDVYDYAVIARGERGAIAGALRALEREQVIARIEAESDSGSGWDLVETTTTGPRCETCGAATGSIFGLRVILCQRCTDASERAAKALARAFGGDWREIEERASHGW